MALEEVTFYPVESSNVSEIGYDVNEMVLYVKFNNEALYYYESVPPEVWEQMRYTESIGKFVHTNLKGIYPYGRVY